MAALAPDRPCEICSGRGCVLCHEPYPSETWEMFSDLDIIQLLADATQELSRRDAHIKVSVG